MQYWVSINDLLARYTIVTSWPSYSLGYLLQIILRAYCIIIRACVSVRSGAQRWCRNYRLQFSRMVPGRPWLYICRVEFSSCRVFFFFFLCRVFFFLLLLQSFLFLLSSSSSFFLLLLLLFMWLNSDNMSEMNSQKTNYIRLHQNWMNVYHPASQSEEKWQF